MTTYTKEQIAEYKKPFSADIAWAAAAYAYRVQGNKYIKADAVQYDEETRKPLNRANKDIVYETVKNPAVLTEEDKAQGELYRRFFKGLMFRQLAGEKLNGFLISAMQVAQKEEFTLTKDKLDLAIMSSLPSSYDRDEGERVRKEQRTEFASTHDKLGKEGDRLTLTVTVDRAIFSQNYFVYFINATADSGHAVRFTMKNSLDVGATVKIKATVKHFEDGDTVCRLNRASIV